MSDGKRTYDGTAVARVEFDRETLSKPPEDRYAPVVTFDDGDGGWSLGMEFIGDVRGEDWVKYAEVDLLADEAPHEKMVWGAEFDISEGPLKVGSVEILVSSKRVAGEEVVDDQSTARRPRVAA